jgi:putative ABC transport system permease protein
MDRSSTTGEPVRRPEARRQVGASASDIWREAYLGVTVKPLRSVLTVLGIVLGVMSLVATVGLSETAARQILGRLDELRASEVVVSLRHPSGTDQPPQLPWNVDEVRRMPGVRAAAALGVVADTVQVSGVPGQTGSSDDAVIDVIATGPGALLAIRGTVTVGRFLLPVDDRVGVRAAVIGSGVARRLHIARLEEPRAIFLNGLAFTVVGILDGVEREARMLNAVMISPGTAARDFGLREPERVIVDVDPHAVRVVTPRLVFAMNPRHPDRLVVSVPPDRPGLRRAVSDDFNALLLGLGMLALVVGGIGIANVMLVNVMERVHEIGLRRAIVASRMAIAGQVLIEAALLGGTGGLLGSSIGVSGTVGVAAARDWIPVLNIAVPLTAPLLGVVVGLLAGCYPAWRAARLEPVVALRLHA